MPKVRARQLRRGRADQVCGVCPIPLRPPSSCGFIFPQRQDSPLFSLPLPLPSRKGQVRPSLPRACPFMAVLFQNVAKFINSPFPETRNHLCRVQRGGRAGSFVGGLDLSPGPGPNEPWRWMGPRPALRLSFPTYRAKTVCRSFLTSSPSLDACSLLLTNGSSLTRGSMQVLGDGLQPLLHAFLFSFLFFA